MHLLSTILALSLDPKEILNDMSPYGEIGLMLIIFAETGLLVGFFLPGDSLLFTAGILANQGKLNLAAILIGCFAAAVIGDQVGFTIGQKTGPRLLRRPDSKFFKREYIDRTEPSDDRGERGVERDESRRRRLVLRRTCDFRPGEENLAANDQQRLGPIVGDREERWSAP